MTRAEGFRTPAERKEYCWHLPKLEPGASWWLKDRKPYTPEEAAVWDFYWALDWLYSTETVGYLIRYV